MKDIADWLEGLGLERYLENFSSNDLDYDAIPELNEADLKEIGIVSLGHRKKLLHAIQAIRKFQNPAVVTDLISKADSANGERRQITVVFCDLVGSTELSTKIDAEDMDLVIRKYQDLVTPLLGEYGGNVARFAGDGILSYFGYPKALEHEAERAIEAALKIANEVESATFYPDIQSHVRIGIATGNVVVGDVVNAGKMYEVMATGETPNLASRLQSLAKPGGVVVCEMTKRLVGNLFLFADEGLNSLRGFSEQIRVWRVDGKSATTEGRFLATRSVGGWTPLIGREAECESLRQHWIQAQTSKGCCILLSGEAGIGKSRLFKHLDDGVSAEDAIRVRLYCEPYYKDTPFYPFTNYLTRILGFNAKSTKEEKAKKLSSFLAENFDDHAEKLPLLANLLDIINASKDPTLAAMGMGRLRDQMAEAILSVIEYQCREKPILVFVEDLHWADPTSIQIIERLLARIHTKPIFLALSARMEFQSEVLGTENLSSMQLHNLSRTSVLDIIDKIAGETTLPEEIKEEIVKKADGVPLFAEELTRSIVGNFRDSEVGTATILSLDKLSVPNALQTSLMARLDKLADVKEFALLCAVIGRDFSADLASYVSGKTKKEVLEALTQLMAADLVDRHPLLSSEHYSFHHALLRDAAYNNLLRSKRKKIHLDISEALLEHFPQNINSRPERVAHHYSKAEVFDKAIEYWVKAGIKALSSGSNVEAMSHLQRGHDLLESISDMQLRASLELQLQSTMAPALMALKGWAAEEVEASMIRVRELCGMIESSVSMFFALRILMSFYIVRCDYENAISVGDEASKIISDSGDEGLVLELAWNYGSAKLWRGLIPESIRHFDEAMSIYDPVSHNDHALMYGQDPGVATLTHLALAYTLLGKYKDARRCEAQAMDLVEGLNHPFTRASALIFLGSTTGIRGEHQLCSSHSRANIEFCEHQGFKEVMGYSMLQKGWCDAVNGDDSGGELAEKGFATIKATGSVNSSSNNLRQVAEAHLALGNVESGLQCIESAILHVAERGEKLFESSLYAVKAQLILKRDSRLGFTEASKLFCHAIELAQKLGVLHFELQAAYAFSKACREFGEDVDKPTALLRLAFEKYNGDIDTDMLKSISGFLGIEA